jgi:redox-sensitive bicupin YhaK (pirin superfamily)
MLVTKTTHDRCHGIGADVDLYASMLDDGAVVSTPLRRSRHGYVQVIKGSVRVNGTVLSAGDGAALSNEDRVEVVGAAASSEVLVFDLA